MVEVGSNEYRTSFRELCYHIGLALTTWQRVEGSHFKLFLKLLNVPLSEVSSVAYYSTESFDARNTMLDRMAHYFLVPSIFKKLRPEWQEIHKLCKDGNLNRNKLAHYTADYDLINHQELPDGSIVFDVTPHTLRPVESNFVSRLQGKTPDRPEHNLGVPEIKRYIIDFRQLESRLEFFQYNLAHPEAPLSASGGKLLESMQQSPPSLMRLPPRDEPPSDQ